MRRSAAPRGSQNGRTAGAKRTWRSSPFWRSSARHAAFMLAAAADRKQRARTPGRPAAPDRGPRSRTACQTERTPDQPGGARRHRGREEARVQERRPVGRVHRSARAAQRDEHRLVPGCVLDPDRPHQLRCGTIRSSRSTGAAGGTGPARSQVDGTVTATPATTTSTGVGTGAAGGRRPYAPGRPRRQGRSAPADLRIDPPRLGTVQAAMAANRRVCGAVHRLLRSGGTRSPRPAAAILVNRSLNQLA